MDVSGCSFETERLRVRPWSAVPREAKRALVGSVLTAAATRELPPHWQGPIADVDGWLDDRAAETPALVFQGDEPIGFLTLYPDGVDLRIGYVLGERWWGQGLASELVGGLVSWAGANGAGLLIAGVTRANQPSARVLSKNGFELVGGDQMLEYRRPIER